jgi:Fis family transcriptional regulator, factor for inversion stimulation protein
MAYKPDLQLSLGQLVESYLESQKDTLLCLTNLHDLVVQEAERPLIEMVLRKTNYNQSRAAAILGLNRNTLKKKMTALKLSNIRKSRD